MVFQEQWFVQKRSLSVQFCSNERCRYGHRHGMVDSAARVRTILYHARLRRVRRASDEMQRMRKAGVTHRMEFDTAAVGTGDLAATSLSLPDTTWSTLFVSTYTGPHAAGAKGRVWLVSYGTGTCDGRNRAGLLITHGAMPNVLQSEGQLQPADSAAAQRKLATHVLLGGL